MPTSNPSASDIWVFSDRSLVSIDIKHDVLPTGWVTMRPREWRGLDEIYAGVFDGMSYEEIEARFPVGRQAIRRCLWL